MKFGDTIASLPTVFSRVESDQCDGCPQDGSARGAGAVVVVRRSPIRHVSNEPARRQAVTRASSRFRSDHRERHAPGRQLVRSCCSVVHP
jgi:hypothetical protein